jgi:hypothetical protein
MHQGPTEEAKHVGAIAVQLSCTRKPLGHLTVWEKKCKVFAQQLHVSIPKKKETKSFMFQ